MATDSEIQKSDILCRKEKREFSIGVFDRNFVLSRWQEIDSILYRVFGNSSFNGKFTRTRPAEHTWKMLHEPDREGVKHVIAIDANNEILGAFFAIPAERSPGKEDCDLVTVHSPRMSISHSTMVDRLFRKC